MKLPACQKNVRMKVIGPFLVEQKSIGSNAPTLTDQIVALLRINGRQRNAIKNIVMILLKPSNVDDKSLSFRSI